MSEAVTSVLPYEAIGVIARAGCLREGTPRRWTQRLQPGLAP
jgi:hypothetical protein